jgi:hypothetical protein
MWRGFGWTHNASPRSLGREGGGQFDAHGLQVQIVFAVFAAIWVRGEAFVVRPQLLEVNFRVSVERSMAVKTHRLLSFPF